MPYRYSMLRFAPDPGRGEFVNIGAIAGDDDAGDWELRLIQNLTRAKAIDEEGHLGVALSFAAAVEDHITALEQVADAGPEPMSTQLLRAWSEEMQNVVRLTAPAPLMAKSAEEALDLVFSELVVDRSARRFHFEKKHRAVSTTRRAYREHGIPPNSIAMRGIVSSGPYDRAFDFAVFQDRVVQLVQCWSFQLPNQIELAEEVKAWAWAVHELRERGGYLQLSDHRLDIPPGEVEVASVYIPPVEGQRETRAFQEARAVFDEVNVHEFTTDQADAVGRSAAA